MSRGSVYKYNIVTTISIIADYFLMSRGSVYKYKCDRGFRMHGSSLLTCTGWEQVDDDMYQ